MSGHCTALIYSPSTPLTLTLSCHSERNENKKWLLFTVDLIEALIHRTVFHSDFIIDCWTVIGNWAISHLEFYVILMPAELKLSRCPTQEKSALQVLLSEQRCITFSLVYSHQICTNTSTFLSRISFHMTSQTLLSLFLCSRLTPTLTSTLLSLLPCCQGCVLLETHVEHMLILRQTCVK